MDRQEDRQAFIRIVVTLLSLASVASAAGALPARDRIALLAVLRHALTVAYAFALKIHAPLDRRLWAAGEDEPIELAEIFRALAVALAFPARAAIRAARWLAHSTFSLSSESPAAGLASRPTEKPRFADTS